MKTCIGCVYFKACGSSTRTEPCNGRMTKSQRKKLRKTIDMPIGSATVRRVNNTYPI